MNKLLFFILLISSFNIKAQNNCTIHGLAKDYANKKLYIKKNCDFISKHNQIIDSTIVSENGKFEFKIKNIKSSYLAYIDLKFCHAFIYVSPNSDYEVILPRYRSLDFNITNSVYFKPDELIVAIKNLQDNDINKQIIDIDNKIDDFISENYLRIYKKKQNPLLIKFIKELEKEKSDIKFANKYLEYSIAGLEYISNPTNFDNLETKYFKNKNLELNNPAYTSLFRKLYRNFFYNRKMFKHKNKIERIKDNKYSYKELSNLLLKEENYTDKNFRDLIIIIGAYDAFNSKLFSKTCYKKVLKEISLTSRNKSIKNICINLLRNYNKLQNNSPAPEISIGDFQLSKLKPKYIYLSFISMKTRNSISELNQISRVHRSFGKDIEFVSIVCDTEKKLMDEIIKKNKYSWKILNLENNKKILNNYNIKSFPSYLIIDNKGNIKQNNAMGPRENIELEMIRIVRKIRQEKYK
ncbi:MAG: thioredoxin family protein [Marinifilaceae bacterium]|jgi:hypothetical protein|nr:thioredoxin family protein [Marinifilaceae bacterium]